MDLYAFLKLRIAAIRATNKMMGSAICERLLLWSLSGSHGRVPNLHGYVHVIASSFYIIGIERFGNLSSQDTTLAARFAVVQAFPGFENIGTTFFLGGVFYLWRLHSCLF
jgi:hypothetical protein